MKLYELKEKGDFDAGFAGFYTTCCKFNVDAFAPFSETLCLYRYFCRNMLKPMVSYKRFSAYMKILGHDKGRKMIGGKSFPIFKNLEI